MRTNNVNAAHALVLAGEGISSFSAWVVNDDIKAGRLVPLLSDYKSLEAGIFAVYPDRRHVPVKVRLFIDALVESFRDW